MPRWPLSCRSVTPMSRRTNCIWSDRFDGKKTDLHVRLYDPLENYDDNASRWFGLGD